MGRKKLITDKETERIKEGNLVARLITKQGDKYMMLKPFVDFPNQLNKNDWYGVGRHYNHKGMKSIYDSAEDLGIKSYFYPPELEIDFKEANQNPYKANSVSQEHSPVV